MTHWTENFETLLQLPYDMLRVRCRTIVYALGSYVSGV